MRAPALRRLSTSAYAVILLGTRGAHALCKLGDTCWPDAAEWAKLSQDLGEGVLNPIADVSTAYSECAAALDYSLGAIPLRQAANGTCPFSVDCVFQDCDPTAQQDAPNLPVYSVKATEVEHVQTAVDFARAHNLRVSVKSTGASYSLSANEPDSLLIWMSHYKKYSAEGVEDNFVDSCGTSQGAVLKVGGGEAWGEVFSALTTDGRYEASSGAAVTVGASGGWLQGGGLGPLDRDLGLGIDNVVQFEVVVPDGSLKTVDACSEPDLFWALRGGGGGNWGVVVSSTSKVHPVKGLVRARIGWFGAEVLGLMTAAAPDGSTIPLPGGNTFDGGAPVNAVKNPIFGDTSSDTLSLWHNAMLNLLNPATMDKRLDGYYGVGCFWLEYMCADLYFRGTMNEFEEAFLAPLRTALNISDAGIQGNAGVGEAFFYYAGNFSSYYDYAGQDCASPAPGSAEEYICQDIGYPSANGYNTDSGLSVPSFGPHGSLVWLVPSSLFKEENATMQLVMKEPLFFYASGHVIGGQVAASGADATAIHPAARSSAMHFILPQTLDQGSPSMENVRALIDNYFPASVSAPCFNHDALNLGVLEPLGSPHGLTWQQMYWGSNLPRLQEIKFAYDPKGIFTCNDCLEGVPPTTTMTVTASTTVEAPDAAVDASRPYAGLPGAFGLATILFLGIWREG